MNQPKPDPAFPYALHYAGEQIPLNIDQARAIDQALREARH
jgi:hypothetical protein